MEAILAQHLSDLMPEKPDRVAALATHISFILEGAMARAGLEGDSALVVSARAMANDMLEALCND